MTDEARVAAAMHRTAELSDDRAYRYALGRSWGNGPGPVFVMLNPSTADALTDDQTIRRCVSYARAWGYDRVDVVNLYAYRATQPAELWTVDDPIGPDNDATILDAVVEAIPDAPVVAAWGANARPDRVADVLRLIFPTALSCLGVTKTGAPRHPSRLGRDLLPTPWAMP